MWWNYLKIASGTMQPTFCSLGNKMWWGHLVETRTVSLTSCIKMKLLGRKEVQHHWQPVGHGRKCDKISSRKTVPLTSCWWIMMRLAFRINGQWHSLAVSYYYYRVWWDFSKKRKAVSLTNYWSWDMMLRYCMAENKGSCTDNLFVKQEGIRLPADIKGGVTYMLSIMGWVGKTAWEK